MKEKLIFLAPVPSRRLGQSLGINNIPPKNCTYSCIYCQIGRTYNTTFRRKSFYKPEEIKDVVEKKIICLNSNLKTYQKRSDDF